MGGSGGTKWDFCRLQGPMRGWKGLLVGALPADQLVGQWMSGVVAAWGVPRDLEPRAWQVFLKQGEWRVSPRMWGTDITKSSYKTH